MAPSCLQNTTTLYRHFKAAGFLEWYDHGHDDPLVFVEYNYFVPTPYSCRFLGVARSRTRRPHFVFVEYNYIVPTPYSCRFLGVGRSRPRRNPSCLQNTTTLYRHLTAAGSWEWYDHGHGPPRVYRIQLHCTDTLQLQVLGSGTITATTATGTPRVCRIQLHCTDTSQLQVLGSGTITATTAPLVFVEYNYIVPTPYSTGSQEWYDHNHDCTPRVCRIQLHCTNTLQLQVLGSGTLTATTASPPLVFVEYNYIVPIPYSCRFLGVVRSRPRRHPSGLQNTTTLYRHYTMQLHCTDTLQLQVLGSGMITATTAPLVFVEYNYFVPTPYSCRFLGVVRSRPRRPHLVFVEYNYIVPTPYSCRFLGVV